MICKGKIKLVGTGVPDCSCFYDLPLQFRRGDVLDATVTPPWITRRYIDLGSAINVLGTLVDAVREFLGCSYFCVEKMHKIWYNNLSVNKNLAVITMKKIVAEFIRNIK